MADSAILDRVALPNRDRSTSSIAVTTTLRRLLRWTQAGAFFVVRGRKNITFTRKAVRAVDRSTGLRSDHTVTFKDRRTKQHYPLPLRRVTFFDVEHRRRFILLTNAFHLPALAIPQLYKCRWQVELFFKWIKQHLRIKHFLGTSPNAVKTQVWIAISAYVLVAILKRELKLNRSQYEILQILSVALFEKTSDFAAFLQQSVPNPQTSCHNQLPLFDC